MEKFCQLHRANFVYEFMHATHKQQQQAKQKQKRKLKKNPHNDEKLR